MGRVSRAQAEQNRAHVVATASRLMRERGTHVSVADLMGAAGLTHGGFYKQFPSKDALVDEATAHAFAELARRHRAALGAAADDPGAARRNVIDDYLSPAHRDDPGGGCPVAAFASDLAREPGSGPGGAHATYAAGVTGFARSLADEEQDGLVRLSTLVGALVLARATRGTDLSDALLDAARDALRP
ncbi:TetR/AcrR family transcriptional regulator [Streptomyces sp. NPDC097619]|uniref:TetR/AcrR family transcriptional regulator n=1 Tax=Streptomyces sp. NPDC097619 TaxID=3157228 RepID=UPI00331DC59C